MFRPGLAQKPRLWLGPRGLWLSQTPGRAKAIVRGLALAWPGFRPGLFQSRRPGSSRSLAAFKAALRGHRGGDHFRQHGSGDGSEDSVGSDAIYERPPVSRAAPCAPSRTARVSTSLASKLASVACSGIRETPVVRGATLAGSLALRARVCQVGDTRALEALLSTEDRTFNGLYRPDVENLQLSNPFASSTYDLYLLQTAYGYYGDVQVFEAATNLANYARTTHVG
jgi:hypothetical protein